ncbi:Sulfate transporter family protein [Taphrina deformans PYCC 5710]|uniref:Sulfate transporter family protein n=1 Tax=Taphrina deformans (strain PYCC 5710 / ATCC 11124 / CBS 356.35 / IMI 108563 / JCM 9778 / NBRC 8474) TaxID=1097556 RepID=R4X9T8_TAPDE|nr:Sulfate transporter family protein [Taphrina deformans PYCC 5710]|eukprot:CCG82242.1 Sulfate transporter family protein [Taphrina deformans PYCC 5710]
MKYLFVNIRDTTSILRDLTTPRVWVGNGLKMIETQLLTRLGPTGQHNTLAVTPSLNVRSDTQKLAARAVLNSPGSHNRQGSTSSSTAHETSDNDTMTKPQRQSSLSVPVIQERSEPPSPDNTMSPSGITRLLQQSPPFSGQRSLSKSNNSDERDHNQDGKTEYYTKTPSQMSETTGLLTVSDQQYSYASTLDSDQEADLESSSGHSNAKAGLSGARVWLKGAMSDLKETHITRKEIATKGTEVVSYIPAVILGLLLNILDALSYGMILFPLGTPIFSSLGPDGISMFYISCIVSQLVFSCGGSIFKGGIGSEMIEVVPFFHQMALSIMNDIGDEHPEAVIATTIVAFAISSIVTGLVFYLLGHYKLGSLIGYFPRHILVGCIGGVGYFLFVTGLEVSARLSGNLEYNMDTLKHLVATDTVLLWAIPLALAIFLEVFQRLLSHPLVVPVYFCAVPIIFYIVVAAVPSLSLATLRDSGWVFEAPEAGKAWYDFYTLYKFNLVNLGALARTIPAMLALTFFGILHVPINVPALGVSTGEDNVDVDQELKAHGISNALSGCLGSIQNYLVYTNSILFIRSGGDSRIAGIMLAAGTAGIMFIGPTLIGKIPVMVVGALIFLLGMDLLKEALIDTIGKVSLLEYLTIVVIVLTMGIFDFVIGIVVGIILACVFFVVTTSKRSAIRARYSGAVAKSTVRRPPVQQKYLREVGHQIHVYKLSGYLFFGSVSSIEKVVRAHVDDHIFQQQPIRFLILDLTLAHGMDFSAAEAFTRMQRQLATKGIIFVLCGVKPDGEIKKSLQSVGLSQDDEAFQLYVNLNSALEACENALLEAFYYSEELFSQSQVKASDTLDVPRDTLASLDLAHSPRAHLLHRAAADTITTHKTQLNPSARYKNFAPPLPLLLQVFQDLSSKREDFWHRLCPFFTREEIPSGRVLWKEGSEATCFYVLESGMIRASYDLETGQLVETIAPGTVAGELPFLSETPRTAELVTTMDSIVWKLDRKSFDKLKQMPGGLDIVRQRHRIESRVAEHKKKTKKNEKKDVTWKSKVKKDPGIPALFPYKGKLLAEMEERKRAEQELKLKQREEQRAASKAAKLANNPQHIDEQDDDDDEMDLEDDEEVQVGGNTIADFAASIASRAAKYHGEDADEEDMMDESEAGSEDGEEEWTGFDGEGSRSALKKETSRKMFDKDFKTVVENSDVILYVLDARDPEGTRSREVEKMVLNAARGEKRLILVLNKIDLVPKKVLNDWLTHLRLSFPTLPLRATSSIASHTFNHKNLTLQSTAAALLKSLKTYAQKRALKRSLTVGIIGFPNVGKSSVINALLSRTNHGKAGPCPTGAEAGVTRSIKELKLDGKVKLLDSPGIVFPSAHGKSKSDEQARLVLMNAIPSQQIVDPLPAANLILQRLSTNQVLFDKMINLYNLPAIMNPGGPDGATDFLIQVARKRGRLGKGGIPDLNSAARAVVTDWCDGRLHWYTNAPEAKEPANGLAGTAGGKGSQRSVPGAAGDKEIVSQWAAEFELGDLYSGAGPDEEEQEGEETMEQ